MREIPALRSYLYAPGSRPELMAKAYRAGADAVILALEDAVAPARKAAARDAVAAFLTPLAEERAGGGRPEVHVRINAGPHGYDAVDLSTVVKRGLDGVRLPKAAEPAYVRAVGAALDEAEVRAGIPAGHVHIYPTVESAAGVAHAAELAAAHPRVARLAFGATDFLADVAASGGAHSPATWYARGCLVVVSREAGIGAPVDSVHTALEDETGLVEGAAAARALGFFGKSVIHPRQLAGVHQVFTPSPAELDRARKVTAAYAAAVDRGSAATAVDGEFVDAAVVARASALLALAPDTSEEIA